MAGHVIDRQHDVVKSDGNGGGLEFVECRRGHPLERSAQVVTEQSRRAALERR